MGGRLVAGIIASLAGHAALALLAILAPLVPRLFPAPVVAPQAPIAFDVVRLPPPAPPELAQVRAGGQPAAALDSAARSQKLRLASRALLELASLGPGNGASADLLGTSSGELEAVARGPAIVGGSLTVAIAGAGDAALGASAAPAAGAGAGAGELPGTPAPGVKGGAAGAGHGAGSTASGAGAGGTGGGSYAAVVARLRARAALCYPRAAQRRELEGIATVRFCVDAAGSPTEVRLVRTSGSSALDDAALDCVVKGAAPLPQPPAAEPCMSVPVLFRLR